MLVEAGAVAFVTGKAVTGVPAVSKAHEGIPGGFGKDGCAGNAEGEPVAFDEGGLVPFELGENKVIGNQVIGKERGESREQSAVVRDQGIRDKVIRGWRKRRRG